MRVLASVCIVVLAVVLPLSAQDRRDNSGATDAERVKVALALNKSKVLSQTVSKKPIAPVPRPVLSDWAHARIESIKDGKPVVVYVGCQVAIRKNVSAHELSVTELGDYKAGTAVVFYSQGGRMYAETAIPCTGDDGSDELDMAIQRASKKTRDSTSKKLNWS